MRAFTPRRATGLVLASLVTVSFSAAAAAALEVRTYLDRDNNPATGCAAATAAGAVSGMELLLVATVDTGVNPHVVTALTQQVCSGGAFGAPVPVDAPYPGPWGVGDRNGGDAADVIELYLPRTAIANAYTVRLAFATVQGGDADALLTAGGGAGDPPILFQLGEPVPALSVVAAVLLALLLAAGGALLSRRPAAVFLAPVLLVGAAGVAWAAVVLDGNPADWQAMSCCANDPVGDAGAGADIAAAHVCVEGDVVYLRLDAGRNAAPVAVGDAVTTTEAAPLTGDVLAANPATPDSDADLDPLTVVAVEGLPAAVGVATTLASGAFVTVEAGGAFTYDPHGAFASLCPGGSATDSFAYTVSDGHGGSAGATVTVTVTGTEDAAIDVEKLVNGKDADLPPGPSIDLGQPVAWTYMVTNTGAVALSQVSVTDDRGVAVSCPKTVLEPGESMTCTGSGTAIAGQYANLGTATARTPCTATVSASDPAHYFGQAVGTQGCTPGFWKNHTDDWPPTEYLTTQDVDTAFANVNTYYPSLGNATLLEALAFIGGSGNEGAAEILLRYGVAALLNAAHPDVAYPRTLASVIADVNAALLQNRDAMLALAAMLDTDNNRGCPLT